MSSAPSVRTEPATTVRLRPHEGAGQPELYAVDFFCGAGGMTQGLRDAGVSVVAGVDIDPSVRATYEANHGDRFKCLDVRSVRGPQVREWLPDEVSSRDLVLVGCSPCQFWSRIPTERRASFEGSRLLLEFGRLVWSVRPGYVVVENVPGLARRGSVAVLQPFVQKLKRAGYAVVHGVVESAWYGVPQRRPRFLLLASRLHDRCELPARTMAEPMTVRKVLGTANGFRRLKAGQTDPRDPWHRAAHLSEGNLARLRLTPPDGGDRRAWRDSELQIPAYQGRDAHFRNVYGRLWWDKPASTLTTRFNSLSNGRFGHPEEDRAISVREGAALQTFPQSYHFLGSRDSVCRQIGNAVPPALGHALGLHLRRMHAARDTRPVARR